MPPKDKYSLSKENALIVAKYLRDSRRSELKTTEAVCFGRRVDCFQGEDFLKCLKNGKYKDPKLKDEILSLSDSQLISIANQMISLGYFHRSQIVHKGSEDKVLEDIDKVALDRKPFDQNCMCSWTIHPSQTRVWILSVVLLIGCITLCLFKVWPLWAKLGVWWFSLIMLISMISVFFIRLVLAALFWIIGFRGLWLFPDLFNEEISVLETFQPLFGHGRAAEEKRRKREKLKEKKAKEEKEKADKLDGKKTQEKEPGPEKEKRKEKEKDNSETVWKVGFLNLALLMICGFLVCNYLGILAGENVPEFLISQNEIWNTYPGLLAAQPANFTEPETPFNDSEPPEFEGWRANVPLESEEDLDLDEEDS